MAKKELLSFFVDYLPQHPELKQSLSAIADRPQLVKALLDAGKRTGFKFSEQEVQEVMTATPSAELSDTQLEAVAGGTDAKKAPKGSAQQQYLIIKFENVLVSSHQAS